MNGESDVLKSLLDAQVKQLQKLQEVQRESFLISAVFTAFAEAVCLSHPDRDSLREAWDSAVSQMLAPLPLIGGFDSRAAQEAKNRIDSILRADP